MTPLRRLWAYHRLHEQRVFHLALLAGLPGVVLTLVLLTLDSHSPKTQWTFGLLVVATWLGFAFSVRERVISPLRTIANLLEAMREGDYSIRARGARDDNALGEVMLQVNSMGATLRAQRLGALEATTLLRKVMEEIDVAVFAFDGDQKLRLVNRAGEKLLAKPSERLTGLSAATLELDSYLVGPETQTLSRSFPGAAGRWGISRSSFREGGLSHQLLVFKDLTRPLREEELQAWQRLVRVLGHELNNSLTPIKSLAGSLETLVKREPRPADWQEDMQQGLAIIASRSEALSRFMAAYSRLARLPQPTLAPVRLPDLVARVARLDQRRPITVQPGPDIVIQGDADQLEQLLINLFRNAIEATLETGGGVTVTWANLPDQIDLRILDEGQGLANTANLFVPFFTTKPQGSGIGLVLCRQIAEAHGGSLTLENRAGRSGCEARLLLPK